jgi:hypothetical protein
MGEKLSINICFDRLEDGQQLGVLESGLGLFSDWIGEPFEFALTVFETSEFTRYRWSGLTAALGKGIPDGQLLQIYTDKGGFNSGMVAFENDDRLSIVRVSIPSELILTQSLAAIEARCLEAAFRSSPSSETSVLSGMELIVEAHGTLDETVARELASQSLVALAVVPARLTRNLPGNFLVRGTQDGRAVIRHVHAAERLHLA